MVLLALLTALAGGVAMAAATGARQSVVVVAETLQERKQPDVMMLPDLPGFDWRPIVERPYVESYGLLAATALCLEETGGLENRSTAMCTQPPVAGGWYDSIARFDVLEGRIPTGPREIAINRLAQRRYGWRVGDRLHVAGVRPGLLKDYWEGRTHGRRRLGPTFEVTVTAVIEGADDAWRVISGGAGQPGFIMSTSFIPTYGASLEYRVQAFLRLRGGEDDLRQLRRDSAAIAGDAVLPIRNVREAQRRVERGTRVEATALWLFAAAVLAAASALLGQALVRLIRGGGSDAGTLRSLGMAPRTLVTALAGPGAVVGVLGAVGAVVLAVAASPAVPIGVARSFDLHDGVKVDVAVILLGALGIAALVALGSAAAAALVVRDLRRHSAPSASRVVASIARLPLPPPVTLGVRMALERRPGAGSIPVRPALIGATVGVLAIVAAWTVREGIVDTLAHPERAGRTADAVYYPEIGDEPIMKEEGIAGAAEVTRAVVDLDGLPTPAYAFRPVGTPLDVVTIDGRGPERDDEIALGTSTASALGVGVGDRLPAGRDGARPVHVVGTALLVEDGGHAAYDEGAWTTGAGLARLEPPQVDWAAYFIDLRAGANVAQLHHRLAAAGGVHDKHLLGQPPAALDNLSTARSLPALLGGFLGLLGAGALGHTLISTVRRRRRDLAVLRALGLTSRGARAVIAWQATTVAVAGLVVGVPLGVVTGRLAWHWIATSMPVVHVAPSATLAAVAIVPATLLLVNALALWPARTAARTRPAAVLRAE